MYACKIEGHCQRDQAPKDQETYQVSTQLKNWLLPDKCDYEKQNRYKCRRTAHVLVFGRYARIKFLHELERIRI